MSQLKNEQKTNEILSRLKKNKCSQEGCRSQHIDNTQIIVFGRKQYQKQGLMCTSCFIDSNLITKIQPVQKYALPIRKYLQIIIQFYNSYQNLKESSEWGPTQVYKNGQNIQKNIDTFYNNTLRSALQIGQYVDKVTRQSIQKLKIIQKDADLQKIADFLAEQNDIQKDRILIGSQLTRICNQLKLVEEKVKYSPEDKIKRQTEQIILSYRQKIEKAIKTLKKLSEVHRDCLKKVLV